MTPEEMRNNQAFDQKKELRILEQQFVNAMTVQELEPIIERRKDELVNQLVEFKYHYLKTCEDAEGNTTPKIKGVPNIVIGQYFFKSLNPLASVQPQYNAEKLALVYDLYNEFVFKINVEIGDFIPNKSHFCKFAGITSSTYDNYKYSNDLAMRNVIEKLDDLFYDTNVSSAQAGTLHSATTIYRMKTEQNKVETVKIENTSTNTNIAVDLNDIFSNIADLKKKATIEVED